MGVVVATPPALQRSRRCFGDATNNLTSNHRTAGKDANQKLNETRLQAEVVLRIRAGDSISIIERELEMPARLIRAAWQSW